MVDTNVNVLLSQFASGCLVSSRMSAAPVREELEITLAQAGAEVVFDFSGISEGVRNFV